MSGGGATTFVVIRSVFGVREGGFMKGEGDKTIDYCRAATSTRNQLSSSTKSTSDNQTHRAKTTRLEVRLVLVAQSKTSAQKKGTNSLAMKALQLTSHPRWLSG